MIAGRRRLCALVLGAVLAVACGTSGDRAGTAGSSDRSEPASQVGVSRALGMAEPTGPGRALVETGPEDRTRRVSVVAGGDILIHESVWESARDYAGGEGYDFAPMFEPISSYIGDADLGLCHLEVPLAADNARLSSFPQFNAPYQLADGIAAAGFDGCSVASNHTLDQGVAGIDATLGHLDRVGLGHAGAARTPDEAAAVTTYDVRGIRIAHLSYTYGFNGLRPPEGQEWRSNLISAAAILDEAGRARAEGAEVVLVSLHWGEEYVHAPSRYQLDVAAAVAPSPDIDFVIGHHAHVIQPVDMVGDTWVTYGLGNLVSNMLQDERRDGALVRVEFEAGPGEPFRVAHLEVLPTWVDLPGHQVIPAPPESAARTTGHLRSLGVDVAVVHRG